VTNSSSSFRDGDERAGWQQPSGRVVPVRERFEAGYRVRGEVDLRLEVEPELILVRSLLESRRQLQLLRVVWIHGRAVAEYSAPPFLGRVRGHFGVLDESVRVLAVGGIEGDADGRIDRELHAMCFDRSLQSGTHLPREHHRVFLLFELGDNDEVIASKASQQPVFADGAS